MLDSNLSLLLELLIGTLSLETEESPPLTAKDRERRGSARHPYVSQQQHVLV